MDYAHISNASYTRVLFLLSKGMVMILIELLKSYFFSQFLYLKLLLIDKKLQEVQGVLNQAGHLIETWTGATYQREYLRVYFLVLQVCHCLMGGQVKSVKPCLRQLQQSIQTIMATDEGED